jgi:hypothetical protein
MKTSNPHKVVEALRGRRTERLCDDCIAQLCSIPNRIAVQQITASIGLTSDFVRVKTDCSRCGNTKFVTQAVKG